MKRSCGILLPISSLPSPHGIGTLGRAAYDFVDFLARAGQSWWQILPVGPTGYGDSPYQSFSTFAGNPYFIDLDMLCADGLLTAREVECSGMEDSSPYVDYGRIYRCRFPLLETAARRCREKFGDKVDAFALENRDWIDDYALFMALKRRFGMAAWTQWPDEDIRLRRCGACERMRQELKDDVDFFVCCQYLFFTQWRALRSYARSRGVGLIGDLPIYVAMDSADVWSCPENFLLDEDNVPAAVAGVPPDYFSADGQLWGNPLYDWEKMSRSGYSWWLRRAGAAAELFDAVRIDHFRGFESFWAVPYGQTTARDGSWMKGPGLEFVSLLKSTYPSTLFIAEDLGYLTDGVRELLKSSGLPGMKVLEFAFDSREESDYLPHTYPSGCVCYTGTHDNAPLAAWLEEIPAADRDYAREYLGLSFGEGMVWGLLRGGLGSVAELFIAQMQDYLCLGPDSRMNTPGTLSGNWRWRLLPGQLTSELAEKILKKAQIYGRSPRHGSCDAEKR